MKTIAPSINSILGGVEPEKPVIGYGFPAMSPTGPSPSLKKEVAPTQIVPVKNKAKAAAISGFKKLFGKK